MSNELEFNKDIADNATTVADNATVAEEITKTESVAASSKLEPTQSTSSPFDSLPEDLRAQLGDVNDIESLAKSYVSAQSMIGRSIRIPGEDASEEAKSDFYKKLQEVPGVAQVVTDENGNIKPEFFNRFGRPESPDGYKYEAPEGIQLDQEVTGEFSKLAHNIGLTQKQANELLAFELDRVNEYNSGLEKKTQEAEQILKQKWGQDFDNRLQGAKTILSHYQKDYPDAIQELANSPLSSNPAVIAMLSDLFGSMQEGGSLQGEGGVQYGTSIDEAREMISEIRSNKNHPFHNPRDPEHNKAKARMNELYQILYPD